MFLGIATKSDIATAQDVFAEMQLAGHEKKTRTYNILMRCAINNSNHDETLKLFKEMAEFSIPASSLTYNLLMTVYSAANDPVSVLKVYFSMITSKTAS